MPRSKTIRIFLKDSDPNGVKIADLSVSTAKIYVVPKDKLKFVSTRVELKHPNIYMLFDDERTSVYIGESEDFATRVKNHVAKRDFWQWALIAVASDKSLDKADVKFLESLVIQQAVEVGRMNVENRTSPNQNNLHEFKQETMLEFFDDIKLLIASLGFDIFTPLKPPVEIGRTETTSRQLPAQKSDERQYDTVVCPAHLSRVNPVFKQQNCWFAIRIGQSALKNLKYIAIYEVAPISSIRYYAKITTIKPHRDTPGKYIVYHDGRISKLATPVKIGKQSSLALQGPRYYKLSDIKASKDLNGLTDRAFGNG